MRNEQEKLAREWAERIKSVPPGYHDQMHHAAADHILATTAPPTMADVEWDDEKHRGLGAVDEAGQEWVMLQDDGGYINCIGLDLNPVGAERGELTPNGKRYELREITEPEHPETLTTVEDYENAPEGTIVKLSEYEEPLRKYEQGRWADPYGYKFTNEHLAGTIRKVKRWGWGE